MKILNALKIAAISLTIAAQANATTIYLTNTDTSDINVIVEPGKGKITPNSTEIKQILKPGQEKDLMINKEALNGASTFSVTGKGSLPSLYNKCGPLSIDKNYKIVFVGGKVGDIVCNYQQVK